MSQGGGRLERAFRREEVWEYNARPAAVVEPLVKMIVYSPSHRHLRLGQTRLLTSVLNPGRSYPGAFRPSLRLSKSDERKRRVSQPSAKLTE